MPAPAADNPFVSHAFLRAWRTAGRPTRARAGCRSTPRCATGRPRSRVRADVCEVAQLRRVRVRPRLGQRLRARRRQTTTPSCRSPCRSARCPARACCGARAVAAAALASALAQACERAGAVLRPRHVLHGGGVGGAGRGRLAAPHRPAVPLGERGLRDLRRLPRRAELAQAQVHPAGAARRQRRRPDFVTLRGAEISQKQWDAFYRFYTSTVDRKWGSAYLTKRSSRCWASGWATGRADAGRA